MKASLRERVLAGLRPEPVDDLSAAGRVRLLDMAFERVRFGMAAIAAIGIPFFFVTERYGDTRRLAVWMLIYFVLSVLVLWRYRRYRIERGGTTDPAVLLARWTPRVQRMAVLHGSALSSALLATAWDAPFEFTLLLVWTLSAVTVGNAVMQAPVLSVFLHFFAAGWLLIVLVLPWAMEPAWRWMAPLALIFSVAVYRLAIKTNRFFVRQIRLEEHSQSLALKYRAASDAAATALADKYRFLSTASHDLRQPLHAIRMIVEALTLRNRDTEQSGLLDDLRMATDSMAFMFRSLLDLSRLEDADAPPPEPVTVRLDHLTNEVVRMFSEDAAARGLSLRLRAGRPAAVHVAPVLLRQALVNLVHNALRYTRAGGVLVAVRRRADSWSLEVWDTGIGVASAPDQDSQLYTAFYREQQASNLDDAGHGLGLAVVKRCAERMDARYGYRSRLGRGSCFWLEIPAVDGPGMRSAAVRAAPLQPRLATELRGRCLVVEDDPQVTAAWRALLGEWRVDARFAGDGAGAWALLDQGFMPQVILCDERLRSGESGFALLQALLDQCPDAAGAMVSGELNSPALSAAEAEGYVVLSKPVDPGALHGLLTQWLSPGGRAMPAPAQVPLN